MVSKILDLKRDYEWGLELKPPPQLKGSCSLPTAVSNLTDVIYLGFYFYIKLVQEQFDRTVLI